MKKFSKFVFAILAVFMFVGNAFAGAKHPFEVYSGSFGKGREDTPFRAGFFLPL